MAIAFAHVSIHSRSKGHSAIAASAYRSATILFDSRTGLTHDFSNRHDVVFSTILLPEDCDPAFTDREFLWNQAELAEKRRDAQICKDVVLALPKELDLTLQIELVKRFAQMHFIENSLPADIAIHDHGDGNPHAHILISTRRLERHGFSKYKARDLNPAFAKGYIVENDYWGERWREMQDDFFVEKNIDVTVDLNHFISERHNGKMKDDSGHYLLNENKLIRQARLELALSNPENVINHLLQQHSVFTRRDVEKLLFKTFRDAPKPEKYLSLVELVLTHKDIINLGFNDKGKESYTTRHQYIQEANLRQDLEKMMLRNNHVFTYGIDSLAKHYSLSDEQHEALSYITQSPDISVVIGRPGTGKSYLLKPVKEYYEKNHCQVIGTALSGKVAKSLQSDTGIESSTIASLAWRLSHDKLQLTNKHVIIVDEAGMVDFNNMALLISEAQKSGSKIVLVGDPDQLKPIHKGEIFKGIAAITGYIELENIKRQNDLGDRQASLNLAKGNIDEALQHYHNQGSVIVCDTPYDASDNLINDWQQQITPQSIKDSILLAFTRASVADLNQKARQALQEKNLIGDEDIDFQGFDKQLKLSTGDRLLFRQNNKVLGVRNGDLGTVKAVNKEQFQIELDSGEKLNIPKSYQAIDYGYALTVHKSQGMTAEHTRVLIDSKYWDRHLSFVAMTRHKQSLKLYVDTLNHPSPDDLKRTLSRSVTKDNVIDWPLDFACRAGFNPDKLVGKVINHVAGIEHRIKDELNYVVNYEAQLLNAQQKSRVQDKAAVHHAAKQTADHLEDQCQRHTYEIMKTKYPALFQYDALLKQHKSLSGYYREKLDRQIQGSVQNLMADKKLMVRLQQTLPEIAISLINQAHRNLNRGLEHGL
ncbi:MAG: Ti-type conjugative transfer relaxase TraA [Legionellaceae bacterium]|nr:Ti-type conjugative transfer relaxase TraA [Legionellaceae bacterium]